VIVKFEVYWLYTSLEIVENVKAQP
jgi:hypothetical protein